MILVRNISDAGLGRGQSIAGAPFNPQFLKHAGLESFLESKHN